jgi:hypothetical protein
MWYISLYCVDITLGPACMLINVVHLSELFINVVHFSVLCRHHFGTSHPLYVKALLHYCHFSSEFKQDQDGLLIAKVNCESCLYQGRYRAITLYSKTRLEQTSEERRKKFIITRIHYTCIKEEVWEFFIHCGEKQFVVVVILLYPS